MSLLTLNACIVVVADDGTGASGDTGGFETEESGDPTDDATSGDSASTTSGSSGPGDPTTGSTTSSTTEGPGDPTQGSTTEDPGDPTDTDTTESDTTESDTTESDTTDSDTTDSDTTDTSSGDGDGDEPGDGDGDGPGDGDGDAPGDGDGDEPGDGDGDVDPNCPPGSFGCPCDMGICDEGLICKDNEVCTLDDEPGDGDGDMGDGDGDMGGGGELWSPELCEEPGMVIALEEIEGQYCAQPCLVDADCPEGPVGTASACAVVVEDIPELCVLVCDPNDDTCPEGASCQPVPMQENIGVCTFPLP